jgi:quinoprotein relay system zinc metallohydrolase 2
VAGPSDEGAIRPTANRFFGIALLHAKPYLGHMHAVSPLSRRQAVVGLCLCCTSALVRGAPSRTDVADTGEIAPGIHVRGGALEIATAHNQDAIANTGFIVGGDCVAVTDAGGSLWDGEQLRRRIRQITPLPIRYVLMSHVHPDHIFGAGAFLKDDAVFVGHAELPKALAQRGEYYRERLEEVLGKGSAGPIVEPTMLVHDQSRIDLGKRVIELKAHPIAHTDNDLSAFDVATKTLFASDLLFVERVPSLDGSVKGWLNELTRLSSMQALRAVPGHGPASVDFASTAQKLRTYLETLLRETREAISKGIDIDAAPESIARSEREKWSLFDEYHGHNVVQAYRELEWE